MSSEYEVNTEAAVTVSHVSKHYSIYPTPRDRLKQFVLPRIQRLAGSEPRQYYRDFRALSDVSFSVSRGETFGIVGKNGSGKSTLLQIICGTLAPTSGEVKTVGRLAALLELGAGFNPEFTGRENVYMNGSVLGLSTEQIDERYDKIAGFADIGDFIDQPVKTYSSGMYVRLAFAVIANVDADILVIDEALAVGDAYFVQKCMRYLHSFMEHGTLLFVSHDTASVQRLCSQAILLNQGQVQMQATPKEVSKRYLADLYREYQDIDGASEAPSDDDADSVSGASHQDQDNPAMPALAADGRRGAGFRDMRQDLINNSGKRSEIEVFRFKSAAESFGTGLVKIESVQILDENETPLNWIVGGEQVVLQIRAAVSANLDAPIIGFELKDRLGQTVFGDNTHLANINKDLATSVGQFLTARFAFHMPVMQPGDYSIAVAVANGSQSSHVQHQWMHDSLIIRIHNDSICFGVVGIPMQSIELEVTQ